SCSDSTNHFVCQCPVGYSGAQCQTEINECASVPCGSGGSCSDLVGGFTCQPAMPEHRDLLGRRRQFFLPLCCWIQRHLVSNRDRRVQQWAVRKRRRL